MEFQVCSDETPPCSFKTARRLLWRNTNNELLPVYDRQLCGCYLQPQIYCCECLGDNKCFLGKVQLCFSLKFEWWTQIWVTNWDLSEIKSSLKFEWSRLVSPRFEWTLKLSDHPELRESRLDHPELSASPIFESGHLPDNLDLWILKFERDLDLWPHTWPWPWIFMVKLWNSCISEWEGRLTLYKGVAVGHSCPFGDQVRCMDLPDSDRGDFSCRRTVDSSSWFR